MSKSILITGSTGFIGSYILEILLKKKYKVFKLVRNKKLKNDEIFCDLSDPNSILSLKNKIKVDVIIHFGAYISFNNQDLNEIYNSNILGTACLVSLAKIWNSKFIFASTALIHGLNTKKINIKSKIVNDHPYTHSKWLGETMIYSAGIDNCILKP